MTDSLTYPTHAPTSGKTRTSDAAISTALILGWAIAMTWAAASGVFTQTPGDIPFPIIGAVATPPLAFLLAFWTIPAVRAFAYGIDLRLLTAFQAWRIVGFVFLGLLAVDRLPGFFAWPAGLGDVAVGLAAPFALLALINQQPGWQRRVLWLNITGLADFGVAVVTGLLAAQPALAFANGGVGAAVLEHLPVSLIPTVGVPIFIIMHIISFAQLRRIAKSI